MLLVKLHAARVELWRRGWGRWERTVYLPLLIALLVSVVLMPAAAYASPANVPAGAGTAAGRAAPAAAPFDLPTAAPLPSAAGAEWISLEAAASGKWIDVNLSRQRLVAYVGNRAVYSTLVSTGTSAHPTPTGRFYIQDKVRRQPMSGPGYYLPNVPYVMHFRGGYAIHGTYWHSNFGRRMSHGCVNLPTGAAGWLYGWARVGTLVKIHY